MGEAGAGHGTATMEEDMFGLRLSLSVGREHTGCMWAIAAR